ncbi:MAG: hypothetical protein NT154_06265 [Verrucomicrobia bacterium]|nr:hypothetical protein [Verrucomicrobiota bacterium]
MQKCSVSARTSACWGGLENGLDEFEQFGGGLRDRSCRAAADKRDGLMGVRIQTEEGEGVFRGGIVCAGLTVDGLAFGIAA